jgi:hypothetical protein
VNHNIQWQLPIVRSLSLNVLRGLHLLCSKHPLQRTSEHDLQLFVARLPHFWQLPAITHYLPNVRKYRNHNPINLEHDQQ